MDPDDVFDCVCVDLHGRDWYGIDFPNGSMSLISNARQKTILVMLKRLKGRQNNEFPERDPEPDHGFCVSDIGGRRPLCMEKLLMSSEDF